MPEREERLLAAIAALAAGVPERRLAELTDSLRERYRAGQPGVDRGSFSREEAVAFCAYRMPATYAAARAALEAFRGRTSGWSEASRS